MTKEHSAVQEPISREKMYDMILNTKRHEEIRRDEINKYYTALFTGVLSLMPILDKFSYGQIAQTGTTNHPLKYFLIMLSVAGIAISISWILTLKRIYFFLKGVDYLLIHLEKGSSYSFITYLKKYLQDVGSPHRITRQVMLIPFTFLILFIISLVFNIGCLSF